MNRDKLKWLFFDMGSTLIDESVAIEHRIREVIEGTDITYEQFLEKKVFFAKQNKPADLATLEYFGLKKTPWHKEELQTSRQEARNVWNGSEFGNILIL